MKFESVLALKRALLVQTSPRLVTARRVTDIALRSRGLASTASAEHPMRGIALGVGVGKNHDFSLAVRVQDRMLVGSPLVAEIARQAHGDVDIRYTGAIRSLRRVAVAAHPRIWYRTRRHPLEIGISVGHKEVTAGTLGCFVSQAGIDGWFILSNNHVLAKVNEAQTGDEILQPGRADGGCLPEDVVAHLSAFQSISFHARNEMDCAIAKVVKGLDVIPDRIHGIGKIGPAREEDAELLMPVRKLGRTTGLTKGRVTAVALDDVDVDMGAGIAFFDNQIEIESVVAKNPFCRGGDSGSLIVDTQRRPTALLFAGSEQGGASNLGLTYANPIGAVISALGILFGTP